MQRKLALLLSTAFGCLAFSAHAAMPVRASDLPHSNDGGTGYIGLTSSAASGWHAEARMRTPARVLGSATGEASTLIDGRPNAQPLPTTVSQASPAAERTSAMGARAATTHPTWGTPD